MLLVQASLLAATISFLTSAFVLLALCVVFAARPKIYSSFKRAILDTIKRYGAVAFPHYLL